MINTYVQEIKTINLKINNIDRDMVLNLMQQGNLMFNEICDWAYNNGTYNKNKCHKELFFNLKEKYPTIKTALQQSIRDNALECCKRSKLKGKIPQKRSNTLRLNILCYSLRGKQLTLITPTKRYKEILHIPDYYKNIYEKWKPKGSTLSYDKKKKQFWIHITFENKQQIKLQKHEKILGIDRGIYNIATLSNGKLYGGKKIIKKKNDYLHLRRQLQKKGTRSAKRKLKSISGKEERFVKDVNHCISKEIVNLNYDTFVLEKLKNIHMKKYGKNFNRKIRGWSYYQLEQMIIYKANALGKNVVYINPAYTSQTCSCCGKIDKTQRDKNYYRCSCGYSGHADINASINIKNKFQHQIL